VNGKMAGIRRYFQAFFLPQVSSAPKPNPTHDPLTHTFGCFIDELHIWEQNANPNS